METSRAAKIVRHAEAVAEALGGKSPTDLIDPESIRGAEDLRLRAGDRWCNTETLGPKGDNIHDLIRYASRILAMKVIDENPGRTEAIKDAFMVRAINATNPLYIRGEQAAAFFKRGENPENQDRRREVEKRVLEVTDFLRKVYGEKSTKRRVKRNRWWNNFLISRGLRGKFKQVKELGNFPGFRDTDTLEAIKAFVLECVRDEDKRELIGENFTEIARVTGLDLMHEKE